MKHFLLLLAIVIATAPCFGADPVALFYLTSNPESIRSFLAHSTQIDLLVPTWYQVDENGLVTGGPDPTVLKRAGDDKFGSCRSSPCSTRRASTRWPQTPPLRPS